MSGLASTILKGEAAFLVAAQAELLTSSSGRDIYRLKTPDLRIGVYDAGSRRLVIFDGAALAALAMEEAAEEPRAAIVPHQRELPSSVVTLKPNREP